MANITSDTLKQQVIELHGEGLTINKIAKSLGMGHSTVAKILKFNDLKPNVYGLEIIDGKGLCKRCNTLKPLDDFFIYRKHQTYWSVCKFCAYTREQDRVNSSLTAYMYKKIRTIGDRDPTQQLTRQYLLDLYDTQDGKCFYSGEELVWGAGNGHSPNSMSVDKIKPELGYKAGNVVLTCYWLNAMKQNASLETLKIWMPLVYEKIQQGYKDGILY